MLEHNIEKMKTQGLGSSIIKKGIYTERTIHTEKNLLMA